MYASFRSVTAKNGKILTPTHTGIVDLNGPGILRDVTQGYTSCSGTTVFFMNNITNKLEKNVTR